MQEPATAPRCPFGAAAARERAELIQAGAGSVDLAGAMTEFAAIGARHELCEGGPSLSGALAAAGLLDEVCLTIAPRLANDQANFAHGSTPVPSNHAPTFSPFSLPAALRICRTVLVDEIDQRLGKAQDCRRGDAEG